MNAPLKRSSVSSAGSLRRSVEKLLVRKLLQALGLNLGSEVCFVQVGQIGQVGQVGAEAAVLEDFVAAVEEASPQVVIILGSLPLVGFGEESMERNRWCSHPSLGAGTLAIMPLLHPRRLLEQPELKRGTWAAALQVPALLNKR